MIITVKSGFARGVCWAVSTTPLIVGRSADSDIIVDDATVSRRQCKIWLEDNVIHLQDLSSRNVSRVNGEAMRDGTLQVGDELAIGTALFAISPQREETQLKKDSVKEEDTHTLSIAEFHEQFMRINDTPDVHPQRQSDYVLIFQLSRLLAAQRTLDEFTLAVRQALESRFPGAYFWLFQRQGEALILVEGAMKGIVQDTIAPLALKALEEERASLNTSRGGLSQRGVMIAPLLAGATHVGAIVLVNDDNRSAFSESDLVTFMAMTELTGPFLDSVVRSERIAAINTRLAQHSDPCAPLIGSSETMARLRADVAQLANTSLNVLIHGESGTGKELIAQLLHTLSERKEKPFAAINCAAIPTNLFESEFFGHTKGAFTGANETKPGFFPRADGGTLFLDEVGDLSLENQAKLLRAIETGTFTPVGAERDVTVDVRIVAATNKNLDPPEFREDLYHRLATADIQTTPLRKNPADIPLLARHFLDQIAARDERLYRTLSEDASAYLSRQPWPGNGRELRNAVDRAAHLTNRTILTAADFYRSASDIVGHKAARDVKTLAEVEMEHIQWVLGQCGGSMKEAAQLLDISRSSLYNKVPASGRRA